MAKDQGLDDTMDVMPKFPSMIADREESNATFLSNRSSAMSVAYSEEYFYDDDDYDDEGGEGMMMDDVPGLSRPSFTRNVSNFSRISMGGYRIWTKPKVQRDMEKTAENISAMMCIPPEAVLVLLRHRRGEEAKIMEEYFSSDKKKDAMLTECGVFHRCSHGDDGGGGPSSADLKSTRPCPICFSEERLIAMKCGHEFCRDCWFGWIKAKLSEGTPCVYMQCPAEKCREVATEVEVEKVVTEVEVQNNVDPKDVMEKFREYQLKSYVETSWRLKWCPGASCELVVVGSQLGGLVGAGQCKCGAWFCLQCDEENHTPATCESVRKWKEKNMDDGESANWILVSTKQCPKCKTRIDKNGGCSHMTCSQCHYHFCWLCMQNWNVHGYERACNELELQQAAEKEDSQVGIGVAKQNLERYLLYFDRCQNHSNAMDFAKKELELFKVERATAHVAMIDEEEKDDKRETIRKIPNDLAVVLEEALLHLVEGRRALKYSYMHAYFLEDKSKEKQILLFRQADLERYTENLSELTEKMNEHSDRGMVSNLMKIVEKCAKEILDFE